METESDERYEVSAKLTPHAGCRGERMKRNQLAYRLTSWLLALLITFSSASYASADDSEFDLGSEIVSFCGCCGERMIENLSAWDVVYADACVIAFKETENADSVG